MLNRSCILAVDEGNRHEHKGTGSNSGKGLYTRAGLRKAGGGTHGHKRQKLWEMGARKRTSSRLWCIPVLH